MDLAIDNLDDRVVAMDASKVDLTKANELVEEILWDESNGTLTVVKMNGSRAVIDTKLEKLAVNFTYNPQTQQLVITLDDGTAQNVDLSSLITEYEFFDSDTIAFEIVDGKVKAIVKNGSITEDHLSPDYIGEIRTQVGRAEMSAKSADASEKNAASSSALSKSYAVGGTGTRDGEDTDNAKYYAEQAKNASDVGALSEIVENHISDKIVHMTESEHGVVSKLGESEEGSLTYNGSEIKPSVATTESTGVVKPDGKSMSVDESGTLSINLDGTTITLDEAKNVIKLADTLKDAINGAFPAANVANNQITTVEGFALDARQANPNIDGSLAKQISDLNGSLNLYCEAIMTPNYAYSEEFTWKFYKCGRIVTVITNSLKDIPTGAGLVLFDNIPNEFIPMLTVSFRMYDVDNLAVVEVTFSTSGKVLVRNYTGNASTVHNIGGNILYVSKEV